MNADQLMKMPLKELRALAVGRGVADAGKLAKAALVAALSERREAPAPSAPPAGSSAPPQPAQAWQPAPPEHGLPIPDRYGRDRLVLLVQDPSHVFAYWEVTEGTLARVRAEVGGHGAPVLVLHGPNGTEQREVDLNGGNYYLAVAPGSDYEAELCLRAGDGRLVRIAGSNRIRTPAAGPSWRTDEAWMEVDESFDDLLALAGLPGSAGSSGSLVGSSGQRFRNARQIRARTIGAEGEGIPLEMAGAAAARPSSASLVRSTVETLSSASLSSATLARSGTTAGAAVALGTGSGSGLGLLGGSSGQLLSSRALSSRALSSRSLSSGAMVEGHAELQYPVDGVFHAPPTGLPKAAEGVASTAPLAAQPAAAPATPPPSAPIAPNAAAPAPAADPLAFIGAPKPASQRKPKPPRA
jgi:hypothetical protein